MKRQFVCLVLYGVFVLLLLLMLQYTDIMELIENKVRTLPPTDNQTLLDGTITARHHRLPARVENSLYSALNLSLRHRFMKQKDKGEPLEDIIHANRTSDNPQPWQQFINQIHRHVFYSEEDPLVEELTRRMRTLKIVEITENPKRGTEFKFFLKLEDGTPIIGKPMRLMINNEPPPYMSKDDFYERFQSEVAAFHLSRILKFHLVPPVVSRYVNLTSEIYDLSPESLKETFFKKNGDTCFTGHCRKKCDKDHAICGRPDVVPVSFALLIPEAVWNGWMSNPAFGRSASRFGNSNYCSHLRENINKISSAARMHLDVVDITLFDFIQGNLDRHHYGQIKQFEGDGHPVLHDNGRGFARSYQDEFDLLYPLHKCCEIRLSTFEKLINVYRREGCLSAAMKASLQTELVQPLLTEQQLLALDRRMVKVLEVIYACIGKNNDNVVLNDGY